MSRCVEARRARPLLGTLVEIAGRGPNEQRLQRAISGAFAAVARVHRLMSRHDQASDLSRINREAAERPVRVHRWTRQVLWAARRFGAESGGAFDIAFAGDGDWRDLLITSAGDVRCRKQVRLDLGGIAKGFAVDRAVAVLQRAGVRSGMVNAGGDLRAFGDEPQLVRIRHPLNPGGAAGTLLVQERALATSARYFSRELFDGRDGRPIEGEISVTVGAANCLTADALTKVALALREESKPMLDRHGADAFFLERNYPPRWFARNHAT